MAAKKYYAVKKGKRTGIFRTWEECRVCVEGCPGAEYKGFSGLEEARAYLGLPKGAESPSWPDAGAEPEASRKPEEPPEPGISIQGEISTEPASLTGRGESRVRSLEEAPEEGTLLAYVDGSYDDALKKYAFGCVFLLPDGRIFTEYGNGDNPLSLQHRNVTGEMLGAMYAVKTAMVSGFSRVELRYDYEGIEKWVTGAWRSKTELTGKYAASMREWGKSIQISFRKVAAHANVYYNELADKMAKAGLREGDGIPKVRRLE